MKKVILCIVLFAVVAIAFTSGLIYIKNNSESNITKNETDDNTIIMNEKTLDLYGTFDENDLIIESDKIIILGHEIQYPQISGLKNKNVEQKINSKIKEKITDKYNELMSDKNIIELSFEYMSYDGANFSNIISLPFYYYIKYGEDNYKYGNYGLNFELVTGEELKLEDIFKNGEDVSIFARMGLYKELADAEINNFSGNWYDNIHYDYKQGKWIADYHWYDDETYEEHDETVEYVPNMTDYEIEKKIKRFIKADKKDFYFSPSRLVLSVDGTMCLINFYDIPDKVVIYDKYLTVSGLFENTNIGHKGLINCSAERDLGKYKETKYESDNLFYDIDATVSRYYYRDGNTMVKYLDAKMESEYKLLKNRIEQYKEIALNNPNKAYFVFLETDFGLGSRYEDSMVIPNNLMAVDRNSKVVVCDIEKRQEVLDDVLAAYRYYNLGWYGTIYNYYWSEDAETNTDSHYYNIFSNKEINTMEDLFLNGIDYKEILNQYLRYPDTNNVEYEFNLEGIEVRDRQHYDYQYVGYDKIKDYIVIRDIQEFVLDDSTSRKYEKTELLNFTRDELNIAYNEIFARHGHDFKSQVLKEYFSAWDWYRPVNGKTISLEELSEIEQYNIELIRNVINEIS